MKKLSGSLCIVLGLLFSGANAQLLDDDFWQHATVDSSVAVDSNFQLWLFIMGPNDSGFVNVDRVHQSQAFVITIADSTYLTADTLYFLPDFGQAITGSTLVRLMWTNTWDDNGFETSGPIDGIHLRMKPHLVPGDSIVPASWDTDTLVLHREGTSPPDAWTTSLGVGGQPDSATIHDVPAGVEYWFAIKSRDEAYNWSPISNNVLKTSGGTLDSTTTQIYELVTTWNKWDNLLQQWNTGQAGPITRVEVTLGVIPQGEAITVNPDGS